jgi:hypothetical protein
MGLWQPWLKHAAKLISRIVFGRDPRIKQFELPAELMAACSRHRWLSNTEADLLLAKTQMVAALSIG